MDIRLEIGRQLNFIISSCRLYDEGRCEEAARIAVATRVLFHNTQNSKGLIGGHYSAPNLRMLSTTMFRPDFSQGGVPLGFIGLYPSFSIFRPLLDDSKRRENIPWKQWWSQEPILALTKTRETITRSQIVLACANKDGGAHVDETRPKEYEQLEDGLEIEILGRFQGQDKRVKLRYANLAILRQVGYEILLSDELSALAL